ncbi:MAG: Protein of unknown function (DUF3833) [Candidatus Nitrotoga sp. SPKER]|nr:MAG: Protein of unknown function (DUF3833) [Candidatus Nitrotoga sp. SPKER]
MSGCFQQIVLVTSLLMSLAAHSQSEEKAFVPDEVFAGRSEGKGEMQLFLGKNRPFTVESLGATQADGRFKLEQNVQFEGEPVQSRSWMIWQTTPGHYTATLTEASGLVVGHTEGSRLTLRYPLNNWGLVMHQILDLTHDGKTVLNYGSIRFLGIPIGQLRETIQLTH